MALVAAEARPEQLKTISVLFADVTGSTSLGERLEPEILRRVMEQYFELARRVIERHGGTVEKFIGDAVMAVFGVPVLHEDDALRAVRAAAELRAELPGLNEALGRDFKTTLQLRTGVNTGEAVVASDDWLALGDAVNVAARLEQAASPGEVLLGGETYRLVREAVVAEELEPLSLRGKALPVAAHRLVEVLAGAGSPPRRLDAPMVGRAHQLRMLEDAFAHAVRERTCSLVTLLGVAGVGKSRLAAELLKGVEATVVRGRCLSYGEGITYWPVVEVTKQLLNALSDGREGGLTGGLTGGRADGQRGTHETSNLVELCGGPEEAAAIRALLGSADVATSATEIAWAVRKLFERAAAARPLVVVFDDVHWGEKTFLDLVEHVTDLSRDAPILLFCLGRPELLDRRPTWGGGKLNATTVLLEPLNAEEAEELIDRLLPESEARDEALRARVREAAAGNPLFLEEIAAVVATSGGAVTVPPTIQALLAARLDQLDPGERRVLERGSVEGKSFHRGAVQALGPEETGLPAKLVTLVRKDLVRPDKAILVGDDAFRFRHLLIRDAAYEGLPKGTRAQLHERFADWLEGHGADLVERDEIVGYHLEQSYRYRRELGVNDAEAEAFAARAAQRLEAAGRRCLDRADVAAGVNLLERATNLRPSETPDISLEIAITWALFELGRFGDAIDRISAARARASRLGDAIGALRCELTRLDFVAHTDPEGAMPEQAALIAEARPVFEQAGDAVALGTLWLAVCNVEHYRCRFGASAEAAIRGAEHATRAGDSLTARDCMIRAATGIAFGPFPAEEAITRLEQLAAQSTGPREAWIDVWQAEMLALTGRFDEARTAQRAVVERMTDRGMFLGAALACGSDIEMEAGNFAEAERVLRRSCELLEQMGEKSFWSTKACELAQAIYLQGRYEEAEKWAREGAEVGAEDDVATQLLSRQVLAKVAARRGELDEARRLVSEAAPIADAVEAPQHQGNAALDFAEVLWLAGDLDGAIAEAERAVAYYRQKGATVAMRRALEFRSMLEAGGTRAGG
jgi:class 3 adenylate cyclase/tetratricopeptide (TPR) repeat protein